MSVSIWVTIVLSLVDPKVFLSLMAHVAEHM